MPVENPGARLCPGDSVIGEFEVAEERVREAGCDVVCAETDVIARAVEIEAEVLCVDPGSVVAVVERKSLLSVMETKWLVRLAGEVLKGVGTRIVGGFVGIVGGIYMERQPEGKEGTDTGLNMGTVGLRDVAVGSSTSSQSA